MKRAWAWFICWIGVHHQNRWAPGIVCQRPGCGHLLRSKRRT